MFNTSSHPTTAISPSLCLHSCRQYYYSDNH